MKKSMIITGVVVTMLLWAGITLLVVFSGRVGSSVAPTIFPPRHADQFFDARYFAGSKNPPAAENLVSIAGAVVPHHQLAGELTGEVFAILREEKPATIFVIGPNHSNRGATVITSAWDWQTPFGTVAVNKEIVAKLQKSSLAVKDDLVCGEENSVGSIMPYIKYYLPKAKVVPIILSHNLGLADAKALGALLAEIGGEEAVFLASVDFSHYLPAEAAGKNDQETIAALQSGNLGRIFQMGDEYLDSPPSIGVLFGAMAAMNNQNFRLLGHSNSSEILQQDLAETTSYLTLIFPAAKEE